MEQNHLETLKRKNEELLLLLELNKLLISTLDIDKLLNLIMKLATKVVKAEAASLMLLDETKQELYFNVALGEKKEIVKQTRLKIGEGIAGWVAQEGQSLIVNDVSKDTRFSSRLDETTKFTTKAILCVPLKVKNKIVGVMEAINHLEKTTFGTDEQQIFEVFASQAAIAIENAHLFKNLKDAYIGAINALTEAINAKDNYTAGHVDRVGEYTLAIAKELGLDDESIEILRQAALLHDVGKIGIPESILLKPGKLTDEEFGQIKIHPLISVKIVHPIGLSSRIINAIKHHHERLDGQGYPDGLKGDQIPLEAKILCVADSYDAMVTNRPYRKGLTIQEAIAELNRCVDVQFDKKVVDAFVKALIHE